MGAIDFTRRLDERCSFHLGELVPSSLRLI